MDLKDKDFFQFQPIGILQSCYKDKFGVPRQPGLVPHSTAELKVRADLQPEFSLQGLEGFSHLWLIFVFHQNNVSRFHAKVHPPRLDGKPMGLFATRSPHRPNPLGLSLVELIEVRKDTLVLRGIDLVDGTPILDVKPYLPHIEAKPEAQVGWPCEIHDREISVEFTSEAEVQLENWQKKNPVRSHFREIIVDTLRLDPRPVIYRETRGKEGEIENSPYRQDHAFRLYEGDIHFRFEGPEKVVVFKILSMHN